MRALILLLTGCSMAGTREKAEPDGGDSGDIEGPSDGQAPPPRVPVILSAPAGG